VLLEAIRAQAAPAAIIISQADDFFALAAIVAQELYGRSIPVVKVQPEQFSRLESGSLAFVQPDGSIMIEEAV
jgi:predicted aconitase with swiveling domain